MFQLCCGLDFKITDGQYLSVCHFMCGLINLDNAISLTFSNVDPNDPLRQFSVTVDLKNDSELTCSSLWTCKLLTCTDISCVSYIYIVVNAEPNIEELPQLITQLNKTNNFHMFCEQLRKLFQQMYTSQ